MGPKELIIFFDCGDTIIDEGTEIRDENEIVIKADLIPGADKMVKILAEKGYTLAIVADGMTQSFDNMLKQHGVYDYFSTLIYSENVGICKPDSRMFEAAIDELNLTEEDYNRIIMVGNNLSRDVKGANNMGIKSVFLDWTPRYPKTPADDSEIANYTISMPLELVDLVEKLESELLESKTCN